ncbi:uncharacterized protein F4822DRAFT_441117 [Hypoxylon trugodes]|uniref:uncharacterized protein n=1 Tax=Hypoxylon trugodes TaxID=326681 RepID=UPI00218EB5A4|nr:uncharacterized protein F4822DRAFT_441117 [Hypoxylon trugodes]KAI1391875.1 hypothetical protein F4822DRAFT_441117 [Hypoxylon trugodes]
MKGPISSHLQQIHLEAGSKSYRPIAHHQANETTYAQEHNELQANLLSICSAYLWPRGSYRAACPRPILIHARHQQQLEELHEAFNTAITDIIDRWWSDPEARFPERMPLEKGEENLLEWLEEQVSRGKLAKYSACQGSWRPDFLVEGDSTNPDAVNAEKFRITEINARFSFNGFMHEAYGQQAVDKMDLGAYGLNSATDASKIIDGLFSLFNPALPLHLLKGEEQGIDIHMFIDAVRRRFGVTPRIISPSDLRLVPNPRNKGANMLCCVARTDSDFRFLPETPTMISSGGEIVEEIHQIGLELHQHELLALQQEILRQVSLRCFNDMRSIFLIHDKRMLGVVKQEIPSLVMRGVLSPAQAHILDEGIVDTVLPGSTEMDRLLQASSCSSKLKDQYILKPARGGKGAGIVFGEDLSPDEWVSSLKGLQSPELTTGTTFVVQARIKPRLYDVILKASGERLQYPLVAGIGFARLAVEAHGSVQ